MHGVNVVTADPSAPSRASMPGGGSRRMYRALARHLRSSYDRYSSLRGGEALTMRRATIDSLPREGEGLLHDATRHHSPPPCRDGANQPSSRRDAPPH